MFSSSVPVSIPDQDERLRINQASKEGFWLLTVFQRPWWSWSLTTACTSLTRKQTQKGTVMIFKLSLHEKRRLHTFSSLSLTGTSTDTSSFSHIIELFPAFAQATHLPDYLFSSSLCRLRRILPSIHGASSQLQPWGKKLSVFFTIVSLELSIVLVLKRYV